MTTDERELLESIDRILRSEEVREEICPIVSRVRAKLARDAKAQMAWEPIPLAIYGGRLPDQIQSSWVFILRAGATTGAERHPNSHQRMMSFEGRGEMETSENYKLRIKGSDLAAGKREVEEEKSIEGESSVLVSDPDVPLEQRWISIPTNVWHQVVVPPEADWAVVSFHSVPAGELIEERPDSKSASGTRQMRYWG